MNYKIIDNCYETRICESEDVLKLKHYIESNHIKCSITLQHCDPIFWETPVERTNRRGAVGARGLTHATSKEWELSRPIEKDENVSISLRFIMADTIAEQIKNHHLLVSRNHFGESYPTWKIHKLPEAIPYTCGVYKITGFDEAYNALRILKPTLTEKQFAYNDNEDQNEWDTDLTTIKLYEGPENCLDKFTIYESVNTNKSIVELTLLCIDIKNNFEYIKNILSAYK